MLLKIILREGLDRKKNLLVVGIGQECVSTHYPLTFPRQIVNTNSSGTLAQPTTND
jgi:hypothetical protein